MTKIQLKLKLSLKMNGWFKRNLKYFNSYLQGNFEKGFIERKFEWSNWIMNTAMTFHYPEAIKDSYSLIRRNIFTIKHILF